VQEHARRGFFVEWGVLEENKSVTKIRELNDLEEMVSWHQVITGGVRSKKE